MQADRLDVAGRPTAVAGAAARPAGARRHRRARLAAGLPRPRRLDDHQRAAARCAARALLGTRLLVWASAMAAVAIWGLTAHARSFDPAGLTRHLGALGDLLAAPAGRWDASWYLSIAHWGYGAQGGGSVDGRAAFFPLYPLLIRGVASAGVGLLAAGVLVSLAALGAALYLTHRLAALELRDEDGRRAGAPGLGVAATALFPMSFFFSAVYSEALYLALSLGVFWLGRRGRWAGAALAGGLAAATRSAGVLLIVPLAILYLYGPREDRAPDRAAGPRAPGPGSRRARLGQIARRLAPRYRLRPDVLWLVAVPVGLMAFIGYLELAGYDALAPFHAQDVWFRHFAGPFGGIWDGSVAAWEGVRQLLSGSHARHYFAPAGGDPIVAAQHNVVLFCFLLAALPAVVGVLRRLPAAYGAYVLAALALPLSYPVSPQPLMSLPRFLAVLFPLHLWTGRWLSGHAAARRAVLGAYALGLVVFTAQFSTWHWVA